MAIERCRSCGSSDLRSVLDLGKTPLANALRRPQDESRAEPTYPLAVVFCAACSLLQTTETIPPEKIFADEYPYFSSSSAELVRHAHHNVEQLIASRQLGEKSLVIEIASNDGYLLRHFVAHRIPVLGIDPAEGPVAAARMLGIETIQDFFRLELAEKLASEGRKADVIIANNVLAHVPETNDFVSAIATVLKPDGVAVLEFPYVVELIAACEFDTIYHEHVFYLSLSAVRALFERHGLFLNDAMRLPIHGGSLRVFASHERGETPRLSTLLASEQESGVTRHDYYLSFASRVAALAVWLSGLLRCLKAEGARIAAYGAAAKGATLLNYVKPPQGTIEYVVDRNPHKQGKLMPGQRIPICAPETLVMDRPDYTLLLSWNFAEEIMQEQHRYVAAGGRFIVPIPHPCIIEPPVAAPVAEAAQ